MKKQFMQLAAIMLNVAIMALVTTCKDDKPDSPALTVSPLYRNILFSTDGKTAKSEGFDVTPSFEVKTNQGTWDAVRDSKDSWLTITKSATGFSLSVEENEGIGRTATVTVSAGEAANITIEVTQTKASGLWENITEQYLKNTHAPFSFYGAPIKDRFYYVEDWITNENGGGNGNVDCFKNATQDIGQLLGFVSQPASNPYPIIDIVDGKLYQTVELEAGIYRFDVEIAGSANGTDDCYIVAALGNNLPNTDALNQALAKVQITANRAVTWVIDNYDSSLSPIDTIEFELSGKSTVSVGFLVNMTGAKQIKFYKVELWRGL